MLSRIVSTGPEGFNVQYIGQSLVGGLTEVVERYSLRPIEIKKIGKKVSSSVKYITDPVTRGGYKHWRAMLECTVRKPFSFRRARVVVLFPSHMQFENSTCRMDRNIGVYSESEVSERSLVLLLNRIARKANKVGRTMRRP